MLTAEVRDALDGARRFVVLSGAGISAESGLATFRAPDSGLWSRFRPEELATPEAWHADPELVWAWYQWRARQVLDAEPHDGHRAIADLQRVTETRVVTQNVDDLHERGGATDVLHLHGSLFAPRCSSCGTAAEVTVPSSVQERLDPPRCARCGARVRPGVVWFGEAVPTIDRAVDLVRDCDVLLVVGTSGLVHPAAGLSDLALAAGARVVEINPDPVGRPGVVPFPAPAGLALPAVYQEVVANVHSSGQIHPEE